MASLKECTKQIETKKSAFKTLNVFIRALESSTINQLTKFFRGFLTKFRKWRTRSKMQQKKRVSAETR